MKLRQQAGSLLSAYSTSRSAACISLNVFAKLSPFDFQILRAGWYGFRIYPSQSSLGQRKKQVTLTPGKFWQLFLQNPNIRAHTSQLALTACL